MIRILDTGNREIFLCCLIGFYTVFLCKHYCIIHLCAQIIVQFVSWENGAVAPECHAYSICIFQSVVQSIAHFPVHHFIAYTFQTILCQIHRFLCNQIVQNLCNRFLFVTACRHCCSGPAHVICI